MEKNIKACMGLIGTCIVRDIFSIHANDANYMVDKFVQDLNPISMVGKSPLLKEFAVADILPDKSNFYQRCINLDLRKQAFDFCMGVKRIFC